MQISQTWRRRWLLGFSLWVLAGAVWVGLGYLWLDLRDEIVLVRPQAGETAGSAELALAAQFTEPDVVQDFPAAARPQNVVLVIADGLGFSQLIAARAQIAGLSGRLFCERLPITGWLTTYSSDDLVTDSAASASAMATGFKVKNRALSFSADGQPLRTILERALAQGLRGGLITDSFLWDATPAAFVAHVASRKEKETIVHQMAASRVELLVGGDQDLEAGTPQGDRLQQVLRDQGYRLITDGASYQQLADASSTVVGLFPDGAIADPEVEPELEDLAELALERLNRRDLGFFLLVETEETDTAAHRHDFARLTAGIRQLDATLRRIVAFAQRDRRTLVIFTSDHETGGLGLISGRAGKKIGAAWATTNHTAEPVPLFAYGPGAERLGGVHDNTDLPRILADLLGLE